MTRSGTATVTLPTDEQILITREFDAPKHLVYKAWTTPELVKRWWHANRGEMTLAESRRPQSGPGRRVAIVGRDRRHRTEPPSAHLTMTAHLRSSWECTSSFLIQPLH